MNLENLCILMNSRNWESAYNLALYLYKAMTEKERFFDKNEMELCL